MNNLHIMKKQNLFILGYRKTVQPVPDVSRNPDLRGISGVIRYSISIGSNCKKQTPNK